MSDKKVDVEVKIHDIGADSNFSRALSSARYRKKAKPRKEYICTCDDDCKMCDLGLHHLCKNCDWPSH